MTRRGGRLYGGGRETERDTDRQTETETETDRERERERKRERGREREGRGGFTDLHIVHVVFETLKSSDLAFIHNLAVAFHSCHGIGGDHARVDTRPGDEPLQRCKATRRAARGVSVPWRPQRNEERNSPTEARCSTGNRRGRMLAAPCPRVREEGRGGPTEYELKGHVPRWLHSADGAGTFLPPLSAKTCRTSASPTTTSCDGINLSTFPSTWSIIS